uniref:Transcription factor AP-4 n=1 Tax=Rhipicephalus appendiculatus TaxID=34631 RepID=A0A131YX70_RHIAP
MALYHRSSEKRRIFNDFRRQEEEVIGSLVSRLSNRPTSPKTQMEQEKRIRREIANSNERRRMQSINAGFQSLRTLLPHHDGEKLSKAAILQHTAEYIYQLEQEKTRLLSQNSQLKRLLNCQMSQDSDGSSSDSPLPKRKKGDNMDDEGIAGMSPQDTDTKEDVLRELVDLRGQLDRERRLRMILEDQARGMESQAYTERIREAPAAPPHHKVKAEEVTDTTQTAVVVAQSPPELVTPQFSPAPAPVALPAGSASPPRAHPQPAEPLPSPAADLPQDLSTHSMQPAAPAAVTVAPTMAVREEAAAPQLQSSPCTSPYHASTSRQNLETIVEAIRHLEGDHLFRDDEPHTAAPERMSPPGGDGSMLRSSLNVLVVHEPALRQQVIQCGTATRRPGVIVANHS